MGPLRITIHSPPRTPDTIATADTVIHNDEYAKEVLGLDDALAEDAIDADLVAKAAALGITTSTLQKRTASIALSCSPSGSTLNRKFSPAAAVPASLPATPPSSVFAISSTDLACSGEGAAAAGFALYDQFIAAAVSTPALENVRLRNGSLPVVADSSARSTLSVGTRKSFSSVKSGFKPRSWWRRRTDPALSCHGCQVSAAKTIALHGLSCSHAYCAGCLRHMVDKACADEARMPPRCCAQALPSRVLRDALDGDAQRALFAAVAHFGTPRHARVYCPDADCGAFIQHPGSVDRKHPLDLTCRQCQARACRTCKGAAHGVGADCPQDWELEAVKRIAGGGIGTTRWRRCHGCRSLLSLSATAAAAAGQRGARMVCRCREELCALCGGVWDQTTGCPNLCGDEEEAEPGRRRGSRLSSPTSSLPPRSHPDDDAAADKRPQLRGPAVQDLAARHALELRRFRTFSARTRSALRARHASDRLAVLERHVDAEAALSARHGAATAALEDRQIAAEMELRAALEQAARSVNLRLKHMEAYCRPATGESRVVTEGNLRELGQQYALRDGMERQRQAKVNVMRERQARRMAELLDAQEHEAEAAAARRRGEAGEAEARRAEESRAAEDELRARQVRLDARWRLQAEVLRREREAADGVEYAEVATPEWPPEQLLDGEQEAA